MKPLSLPDALLVEINHRAANNFQLAASALRCHARKSDSTAVQCELLGAASQLLAMAVVHRRLCHSPRMDHIDLCQYLRTLVAEMHATVSDNSPNLSMVFATEESGLPVAPMLATRLGLIVTELLMNCVKYAGKSSSCMVTLARARDALTLEIRDDGPGLPSDTTPERGGVGMHLLQSLCSSLDGTLASRPTDRGACFVVAIPIPRDRGQHAGTTDERLIPSEPLKPRHPQQRRNGDSNRWMPPPAGRGIPLVIKPLEHDKPFGHADIARPETNYRLLLAHRLHQFRAARKSDPDAQP